MSRRFVMVSRSMRATRSVSSPVAADSRGLGTGHFFDRSGQLLATVVQEGIVKYFPGAKTERA